MGVEGVRRGREGVKGRGKREVARGRKFML